LSAIDEGLISSEGQPSDFAQPEEQNCIEIGEMKVFSFQIISSSELGECRIVDPSPTE
jgi:hypothetical protein